MPEKTEVLSNESELFIKFLEDRLEKYTPDGMPPLIASLTLSETAQLMKLIDIVFESGYEAGYAVGVKAGSQIEKPEVKKETSSADDQTEVKPDPQDHRHALFGPGLTLCGVDVTPNIEVTEGGRVNCPTCKAKLESLAETKRVYEQTEKAAAAEQK